MAYRGKIYVCFDTTPDMPVYNQMKSWTQDDSSLFQFHNDCHMNPLLAGSPDRKIRQRIKDRLNDTDVFVILIGQNTRNANKFTQLEMEQAVALKLPIIAMNLNGSRTRDKDLCPDVIYDELALHICYDVRAFRYALAHWPERQRELRAERDTGPFNYGSGTYRRIGM